MSTVPVKVWPDRAWVVISTCWPTATLLISNSFTAMRKVSWDMSYRVARVPLAADRASDSILSPALKLFSTTVPEMGAVMV